MPVERHRVARLAGESVLRLLQQPIPLSRGKGRRLFARDGHRVRLVYFRLLAAALGCTESTQNQLSSSRLLFAAVEQPCC